MKYGLLGKTLSYSHSPRIHGMLGEYEYELYERKEDELDALLADPTVGGLSVTIPYKEVVMKYCDFLSDRAKAIGCVNTLVFDDKRKIHGDNTDYYGFSHMLDLIGIDVEGKDAVILGNGATSGTVEAVLKNRGARCTKLSRRFAPTFADAKDYASARILVNTTPVGTYPDNGSSLVSLDDFPLLEAVADVVYNPRRTKLILEAREKGIPHCDGLPMLVAQAAAAAELFTGNSIPDSRVAEILRTLRREFDNIVLIGMPGVGKSSVGRALAVLSGKTFVDLDEEIEKVAGRSIPEIFATGGESEFRRLESDVAKRVGKEGAQVIACGGGIVTGKENYAPLAQNGRIYALRRGVESLDTAGRPLSRDRETLEIMEKERAPLYRFFADVVLENTSIEETARKIWEDFCEHLDD